jgi:hypothetical protein
MSTRARIAIKNADGSFASIYTHSDGCPEYQGDILLTHYNTQDKVRELIDLGDMSSLDTTPDECSTYRRRDPTDNVDPIVSPDVRDLRLLTQDSGGEWLYVFDNDTWYVAKGGIGRFGLPADKAPGDLKLLAPVVRSRKERNRSESRDQKGLITKA